jgi:hypothetical protein
MYECVSTTPNQYVAPSAADPELHYFGKLNPDPHQSKINWIWIRMKSKFRSFRGSKKIEPWRAVGGRSQSSVEAQNGAAKAS